MSVKLQTSYSNRDVFPNKCIHELFVEQARSHPDKVAVSCRGKELSYSNLDRISNNLANYLTENGAGPEKVVAVCVERSMDLIVVLLGILKTGGCYLFIEPNTPINRISFILGNAQPSIVVTLDEFPVLLPETGIRTIKLGRTWMQEVSGKPRGEVNLTKDHLAYISFTSGSTGVPKGVCISHSGVVRLVKGWSMKQEDDVFLQVSSAAFDASTLEIWTPLCNGGRLAVYGPGPVMPDQLAETIVAEGVTTAWFSAGMFHIMVNDQLSAFAGIQHVIAGGDVLSRVHVARLLEAYPNITFTNGYGPTENTTFTTCWTIEHEGWNESIPIGKPISGTQVVILDEDLNEVPVGSPGELYTYGEGLARCYLNMPKETAERFIPNPFSNHPEVGDRMYKTGDMAKWREDGNIEFLGRMDHQVKVRGYRVEIAEIETALLAHPDVRYSAVGIQRNELRGNQLIGYVVIKDKEMDTGRVTSELHDYLKDRLPYYMIPWSIIPLDEIPLTSNGKVDRSALVPPSRTPRNLTTEYVAPRTELEWMLANIWEDLLSKESISIHDDFFDIGGHSLLAAELIQALSRNFGLRVPARVLYLNATIAELASAMDSMEGGSHAR